MYSVSDSYKGSIRPDYQPCYNICCICKKIGKKKSKKFNSIYALKYHLTTSHNREDEISAGVTREEILEVTRAITKALDWHMFDLTRSGTVQQ